ncbi:hypothetical protein H180DRAFT_03360 [Streptomyces sp. WMMB 322]|nr:hypothetical protein H180DRAFT_03360 [Streptomyces sp. WMMB 322]
MVTRSAGCAAQTLDHAPAARRFTRRPPGVGYPEPSREEHAFVLSVVLVATGAARREFELGAGMFE